MQAFIAEDTQTRQVTQGVTFPRQLATTLAINGATYRQIERAGQIAIFEGPQTGMFEVIVIQVKPPGICPSGSIVPLREVYPVAEQWGTYGWTFTSASHGEPLPAARERARQLLEGGHGYAAN